MDWYLINGMLLIPECQVQFRLPAQDRGLVKYETALRKGQVRSIVRLSGAEADAAVRLESQDTSGAE